MTVFNNDLGYVNLTGKKPESKGKGHKVGWFADRMLFWLGFLLPLSALLLECNYHICARQFFDPLPSHWHVFLFSLIPASNFMAWLALRADLSNYYGLILFANGTAIGVAILYTLMFLPLVPTSLMFVLMAGFGLLGLAPMLSLISLWKAGKVIENEAHSYGTYFNPHQIHHLGHIVILLTIIAVELPSTFTRIALGMAAEHHTETKGLELLRAFGSQEVMLRACYERSGRATDIVGSLYESHNHMSVEEARRLFYRATGRTFNSYPIPATARATMQNIGSLVDDGAPTDEFDMDPDIAGEMVSGVSRGLSVLSSDMKTEIDGEAAVAKVSWLMSFGNESRYDREIRTRISLPPGGVINQASLIVDGQEYEADIMVKEEAREVYRQAVASKRNPLMVSYSSDDTVLVQAFPVPPKNRNKVVLRLGIAAPVSIDRNNQGMFVMPQFEERNFQVNVPHHIEIASASSVKAPWGTLKTSTTADGKTVIEGNLDGSLLATGGGIINVARTGSEKLFSSRYTEHAGSDPHRLRAFLMNRLSIVYQKMQPVTVQAPADLHVVIDGSAVMAKRIDEIADSLENIPASTSVYIYTATDAGGLRINSNPMKPGSPEFKSCIAQLRRLHCVGGQEDTMALSVALQDCASDLACQMGGGVMPMPGVSDGAPGCAPAGGVTGMAVPDCMDACEPGYAGAPENAPVASPPPVRMNGIAAGGSGCIPGEMPRCAPMPPPVQTPAQVYHAAAHGAVLWIHGAQPIAEEPVTTVRSMIAPTNPQSAHMNIYDLQVASGPNQIWEGVSANPKLIKVAQTGSIKADLCLLFDQWNHKAQTTGRMLWDESRGGTAEAITVAANSAPQGYGMENSVTTGICTMESPVCEPDCAVNTVVSSSPATAAAGMVATDAATMEFNPEDGINIKEIAAGAPDSGPQAKTENLAAARQTMPELVQLWAYQRVLADIRKGDYSSRQEALWLARRYHIVTPLSSAILVLDVPQLAQLTPEPLPENGLKKLCMDVDSLNPFKPLLDGMQNSISRSFGTVVCQLNRLNCEEGQVCDQKAQMPEGRCYSTPPMTAAPQACEPAQVMGSERSVRADYPVRLRAASKAVAPAAPAQTLSEGESSSGYLLNKSKQNTGNFNGLQGATAGYGGSPAESTFNAKESKREADSSSFAGAKKAASADELSANNELGKDMEKSVDSSISPDAAPTPQPAQDKDDAVISGVDTAGTVKEKSPAGPLDSLFGKPVPESDTWWLLAAVLAILAFVIRKRAVATKA